MAKYERGNIVSEVSEYVRLCRQAETLRAGMRVEIVPGSPGYVKFIPLTSTPDQVEGVINDQTARTIKRLLKRSEITLVTVKKLEDVIN